MEKSKLSYTEEREKALKLKLELEAGPTYGYNISNKRKAEGAGIIDKNYKL